VCGVQRPPEPVPAEHGSPGRDHGVATTGSRSRRAGSSSAMSFAWRTMCAGARRRRTRCTPKRRFGHRRTWLESNGHRRTKNEARHRPFPRPQRHNYPTTRRPDDPPNPAASPRRPPRSPVPEPATLPVPLLPTSTNHHDHPRAANARGTPSLQAGLRSPISSAISAPSSGPRPRPSQRVPHRS
jgi:hypothetical protein